MWLEVQDLEDSSSGKRSKTYLHWRDDPGKVPTRVCTYPVPVHSKSNQKPIPHSGF
ncbi:hypothetical protein M569_13715 [Genlisea aurea]|uniref:Uncharacterized protein n=1 Tax=Genlisea aurea TaxID=192259 RepID=S8C2Q5_9LAMI|nr:hypothetical protein M569_13715 [Genlisea aurea]